MHWDVNNSQAWAVSQKLAMGMFEWVADVFDFTDDFIKNYDEDDIGT